jgi:hypothetical protein
MKAIAVLVIVCTLLAAAGRADVVEWQDAAGVQHYTNVTDEVPPGQVARVIVSEPARQPQGSAAPTASESETAPPRDMAAAYDGLSRAYLEGLERGLALGGGDRGGNVYISGPLAVTIATSTPDSGYVSPGLAWPYDSLWAGYYPFVPGYYPLVGPFRQHRSKHHAGHFKGFPFADRFALAKHFITPAGPPPLGAAGPPPLGVAFNRSPGGVLSGNLRAAHTQHAITSGRGR